MKEINHLELESFIDGQLKREKITKNTIRHCIIDLNSLFNWAIREEILSANPIKKVNRKRIKPDKVIKQGNRNKEYREGSEGLFRNHDSNGKRRIYS